MGFSALHNFACKRQLESASYVTKCDQSNQSSSKYYLLYKSEIGIRKGVSACKAISNTSRRGRGALSPLLYVYCFIFSALPDRRMSMSLVAVVLYLTSLLRFLMSICLTSKV